MIRLPQLDLEPTCAWSQRHDRSRGTLLKHLDPQVVYLDGLLINNCTIEVGAFRPFASMSITTRWLPAGTGSALGLQAIRDLRSSLEVSCFKKYSVEILTR